MATANDLRQMEAPELTRMLGEQREALFNLKLKLRTGHLENTASLVEAKKDIARLQTLLRERALGLSRQAKAAAPAAPKVSKPPNAAKSKSTKSKQDQ